MTRSSDLEREHRALRERLSRLTEANLLRRRHRRPRGGGGHALWAATSAPASAATDPDRSDTLTYSILGGHNLFEIDAMNGQLRTKVELEADEGVTSHTLTVEVSDMLNSSDDEDPAIDDSIEVTVTVTNVNERPVVDGSHGPSTTPRTRAPPSRTPATPQPIPRGATIIWSLGGNDGGKFAISSGGVLSFAAEPDFEASRATATATTSTR